MSPSLRCESSFAVALWLSERDKRVHDKAVTAAINAVVGGASACTCHLLLPKRIFGHDTGRVDKLRSWLRGDGGAAATVRPVSVELVRHGQDAPMRLLEWLMSLLYATEDSDISATRDTHYVLAADIDLLPIMPILRLIARRHRLTLLWYSESETSWLSESMEGTPELGPPSADDDVVSPVLQNTGSGANAYMDAADLSDDLFGETESAGKDVSSDAAGEVSQVAPHATAAPGDANKKSPGKARETMKTFSWQKTLDVGPQAHVGWGEGGSKESTMKISMSGSSTDVHAAATDVNSVTDSLKKIEPFASKVERSVADKATTVKRTKNGVPEGFDILNTLPTLQTMYELTRNTSEAFHQVTTINGATDVGHRFKALRFAKLHHMIEHMIAEGLLKAHYTGADRVALSVKGFCFLLENDGGNRSISALDRSEAEAARLLRGVILSHSPPLMQALLYALFDVPRVRIRFNEPVKATQIETLFESFMGERFVVYLKRAVAMNVIEFNITDDGDDGLITLSKSLLKKCASKHA